MPYKKTIVCLANSRKWQGRCVAGLEILPGRTAEWVRPVSGMEKGTLVWERFCGNANGRDPRLLDLLEIEFLVPQPHTFQVENHRIDPRLRWTYRGSLPWQKLLPHVERTKNALWMNAGSSRNGHNDMVPADAAPALKSSLKLVQPEELRVTVTLEGSKSGEAKRRIRGEFALADSWYILSITDCAFEQSLMKQVAGFSKVLRRPLLCVSVSEVVPQMHACYKLIAGVVSTET
jgi:hypothetical protein